MTRDEVAALMSRLEDALACRDAAALAELHGDESSMETPTGGGIVVGGENVRQVYEAWFKAFPDLTIEADRPVIDGMRTAQLFTVTGTDTGGFLGLPPTGKRFRLPLVLLCEIDRGRIVRSRTIYDFSGMLIQLGVLKARAS